MFKCSLGYLLIQLNCNAALAFPGFPMYQEIQAYSEQTHQVPMDWGIVVSVLFLIFARIAMFLLGLFMCFCLVDLVTELYDWCRGRSGTKYPINCYKGMSPQDAHEMLLVIEEQHKPKPTHYKSYYGSIRHTENADEAEEMIV